MAHPDLSLELAAGHAADAPVCGVDEVGRGPLAGPVIAAAVIWPAAGPPPELAAAIDDSKRLTQATRELLAPLIQRHARAVALAQASVEEIDRLNILRAALLAMQRAAAALTTPPALVLVDGRHLPALPCPARAVIKGDSLSLSIAAASIVAKVERDRIMTALAVDHPGYGWERNAGYPTAEHRAALVRLGPTPHHRRSFGPVADWFRSQESAAGR